MEFLKKSIVMEKLPAILVFLALLPLLWLWLPVMTYFRNRPEIVRSCLYSGVNSLFFIAISLFNLLVSLVSWHGEVLGFFLQVINVILYVGISGFLIYLQGKNGSIEFKPYEKLVEKQLIWLDGRP